MSEKIEDWLKSDIIAKVVRYDELQERYRNQNLKHFNELCDNYFDDYPLVTLRGKR